ncbi:MAG: glycosyltransferase [Prosthecobacter sp.]
MRILWIKTSPLHPLTRGGDLRTFHLLRWLIRWHEVTFAGMVADSGQETAAEKHLEYSRFAVWTQEPQASLQMSLPRFLMGAAFNLFSAMPYAAARFESAIWRERIRQLLREQKFDLLVCDFLFPAVSLPWDDKVRSAIPWVIFQHNVESMIWLRRAENKRGLTSAYWRSQWRRMERHEAEMCSRFDGIVAVSEEDASIFRERFGLKNVIGTAPTGVDLEFFQSIPREPTSVPTAVFVGSMDWYANVDAVLYFVRDVWPEVRQRIPKARFLIVGRQPPPEILSLHTLDKGVEVTGTVPDVRPYMRQAQLMVVPLRIGGGTRLKIYEAMAAELPVVSTTIGAEGLPVSHGRHLLIADDAETLAKEVVRLMSNPDLADTLRQNALNEVAGARSWEAAARVFECACRGLLKEARQ